MARNRSDVRLRLFGRLRRAVVARRASVVVLNQRWSLEAPSVRSLASAVYIDSHREAQWMADSRRGWHEDG